MRCNTRHVSHVAAASILSFSSQSSRISSTHRLTASGDAPHTHETMQPKDLVKKRYTIAGTHGIGNPSLRYIRSVNVTCCLPTGKRNKP